MSRCIVLFAREPGREARDKGLPGPEGAALFQELARAWRAAADGAGARLLVSTPREDVPFWHRRLSGAVCRAQRGASFGERLENAARDAASAGGRTILVGGDVPASPGILAEAFAALEGGADAVLAPAPDGGVSLISIPERDLNLLRAMRPRRRRVFAALHGALVSRGRRVGVIASVPDVDGRRSLRAVVRTLESRDPFCRIARSVDADSRHGHQDLRRIVQASERTREESCPGDAAVADLLLLLGGPDAGNRFTGEVNGDIVVFEARGVDGSALDIPRHLAWSRAAPYDACDIVGPRAQDFAQRIANEAG